MSAVGSWSWKGKRVLVVAAEGWGPSKLSKHHYAATMAKAGAAVYFLGPAVPGPVSCRSLGPGLPFLVSAPPMLKGLRFLPKALRAAMEARHLARIARACGGGFDLLWNFDLYRYRWLRDRTHARQRILHVMDLPVPSVLAEPSLHYDGVLTVSPRMLQHLPEDAPPHRTIPHGIALHAGAPPELPALAPSPRLAFMGNMSIPFIDMDSLDRIMERHPDATLYLIGPVRSALGGSGPVDRAGWERLLARHNVKWVGEVPSEHVPHWLAAMDLLLIPYDSGRFPMQTVNSHKLLEYLHSGRPILSSNLLDMADLGALVRMMPPGVPISEGIEQALADLPADCAPERVAARVAYASALSYEAHLATIASFITSLSGHGAP